MMVADKQSFQTDLIMTMSHEMRTPLHAIIGESDHLEWLIKVSEFDL
jgi:signal transduction histidine kinase